MRQAEDILFERVTARLSLEVTARLEALVATAEGDDELDEENPGAVLAQLKANPGGVSLAILLEEMDKLETVRAIGLPANLFAGVAPRVVARLRVECECGMKYHALTGLPVEEPICGLLDLGIT